MIGSMEENEEMVKSLSKSTAVTASAAMALFYVGILYAPTLILRLPHPTSFKQFMIRRFICAFISSLASLIFSALILPIDSTDISYLLSVYGIRADHFWQAVVFPVLLTCLMYSGSLFLEFLSLLESWKLETGQSWGISFGCIKDMLPDIKTCRTIVVAPLSEELVFRACMIPLLLCGGFRKHIVVFLCPVFFSLAHLNHFLEFYYQRNRSLLKTSMIVGFQLGYTVIFGSYASFLYIRTGNLVAPLVAHIVCNYMGLPVMFSQSRGMVALAFLAGMVGFLCLLFPLTRPDLYNDRTGNCKCWHGYCSWNR